MACVRVLAIIALSSVISFAELEGHAALTARDVIWEFSQGNAKFVEAKRNNALGHKRKFHQGTLIDDLIMDHVKPVQRKAIVISESRAFAPIDEILNSTGPGEIQVVRVCGVVCGRNDPFDGVIGSVEFVLNQSYSAPLVPPPLVLVLGNSGNEVVDLAVRLALKNSSRQIDIPKDSQFPNVLKEEDLEIVQEVMLSARDAILQDSHATFDELCDMAAKLNVWHTVETLLTTSVAVHDAVLAGILEVHGGFYQEATGKLHFLGKHPAQQELMDERPSDVFVRTANAPTVSPEQAIAMLYAGNKRYVNGNGGIEASTYNAARHTQLSQAGQSPFAVILGCADSRAPPEILFDARPGDLFVLRTAGNTCSRGPNSILGSAEYAIGHLRSKLVVVMGHTKCGAITAAVDAVRTNRSLKSVPGSIGSVLAPLHREAYRAVHESPEDSVVDQVERATELNVFATIEKLIKSSSLMINGIRKMDLQVHGAIFDIETGAINWLGQHPQLPDIVGSPLPVHTWKISSYVRAQYTPERYLAKEEISRLRTGNMRFLKGASDDENWGRFPSETSSKPFAVIVGGAELKVPYETLFDTKRGDVLIQRCMGSVVDDPSGTLFASLEFAVRHFSPKLLLVLGESDSAVITSSLSHVGGAVATLGPTHVVLDRVAVSAYQALVQTNPDNKLNGHSRVTTSGGRDMKRRRLTMELNALYTAEQLLRHSKIIRNAVKQSMLEIHIALLHEGTGKVDFIGTHPMQGELLKDVVDIDANIDIGPPKECHSLDPNAIDHEDHSSCDHDH